MLQAGLVCAGQPVRRRRRRQHAAAFVCGVSCVKIGRDATGSPQPPQSLAVCFAADPVRQDR